MSKTVDTLTTTLDFSSFDAWEKSCFVARLHGFEDPRIYYTSLTFIGKKLEEKKRFKTRMPLIAKYITIVVRITRCIEEYRLLGKQDFDRVYGWMLEQQLDNVMNLMVEHPKPLFDWKERA
jgi:hypothetical protein